MILIRTMVPEDMLRFSRIDPFITKQEESLDMVENARFALSRGPCMTAEEAGIVKACGGIWIFWPGTAEGWVRVNIPCFPSVVIKIKKVMMEWAEEHHLNRIQAPVETGWKTGEKFLKWVGMKAEGVMERYGPNDIDYTMYAWVRPR